MKRIRIVISLLIVIYSGASFTSSPEIDELNQINESIRSEKLSFFLLSKFGGNLLIPNSYILNEHSVNSIRMNSLKSGGFIISEINSNPLNNPIISEIPFKTKLEYDCFGFKQIAGITEGFGNVLFLYNKTESFLMIENNMLLFETVLAQFESSNLKSGKQKCFSWPPVN